MTIGFKSVTTTVLAATSAAPVSASLLSAPAYALGEDVVEPGIISEEHGGGDQYASTQAVPGSNRRGQLGVRAIHTDGSLGTTKRGNS